MGFDVKNMECRLVGYFCCYRDVVLFHIQELPKSLLDIFLKIFLMYLLAIVRLDIYGFVVGKDNFYSPGFSWTLTAHI